MTANSHDTLVAGLLIGASLTMFGIGIMWFVRSEWAERQATKAERIITTPAVQQDLAAAPFWNHADVDAVAEICGLVDMNQARAMRDALARMERAQGRPVLRSVPMQRDGSQR